MSGDISGIEANDKTGEITINLTEPDTKFLFALGEVYAAPDAGRQVARQAAQAAASGHRALHPRDPGPEQ